MSRNALPLLLHQAVAALLAVLMPVLAGQAAETFTISSDSNSPSLPTKSAPIEFGEWGESTTEPRDSFWEPSFDGAPGQAHPDSVDDLWTSSVKVGYKNGFVISCEKPSSGPLTDTPYFLRISGWGQLRNTHFSSDNGNSDLNQFQLKRARLVFSGSVFTEDFSYYTQIDGRSSSGDEIRLLDYYLSYDIGHHCWGLDRGVFGLRTGKYKMPNSLARYLSGRQLEFSDRSMASTFFDVNRSLGWGLFGRRDDGRIPLEWEIATFNGLVTGGAETGSSGALDNNFAFSGRVIAYPHGEWGSTELADLECHRSLATRMSASFANSVIDRAGRTEFNVLRVVDSGQELANVLPPGVDRYRAQFTAVSSSFKWRGWSGTLEYYFRTTDQFGGVSVPKLLDHGHWLQIGKFVVPEKIELLTRWSRVVGNSGTLGQSNQSSDEVAGGFAWYFRGEHAKVIVDASHLNGAPINSSALDISRGDEGWLVRTQIQFAF